MHTFALVLSLLASAPAPYRPAPVNATNAPGAYRLVYGGTSFRATCAKGGAYQCDWQGSPWSGTWTYTAGRVTVRERPCSDAEGCPVLQWSFPLKRDKDGTIRRRGLECVVPPESGPAL